MGQRHSRTQEVVEAVQMTEEVVFDFAAMREQRQLRDVEEFVLGAECELSLCLCEWVGAVYGLVGLAQESLVNALVSGAERQNRESIEKEQLAAIRHLGFMHTAVLATQPKTRPPARRHTQPATPKKEEEAPFRRSPRLAEAQGGRPKRQCTQRSSH